MRKLLLSEVSSEGEESLKEIKETVLLLARQPGKV